MKNVFSELMDKWHDLLDGNISVPVYRTDAPISESGNYVVLRVESETNSKNKSSFVSSPVVIVEIVTKFSTMIDDTIAFGIDDEIKQLLFSSPTTHNLVLDNFQATSVNYNTGTVISEDDGEYRYNRLITRYNHRIKQ